MTTSLFSRTLFAAPAVFVLAACTGESSEDGESSAAPESDIPTEIAERQANFEAIGDSFKLIRTQLESGEPDLSVIAAEAAKMGEKGQAQADLFPEGTSMDDGFDTEALAVIWEEQGDFGQKGADLGAATVKMVELAESGDAAAVAEHAKALGGTCKACHDKFRVKKD